MQTNTQKNVGKRVVILMLILAILVFGAAGIFYYLNQFYHAETKATNVFLASEQKEYSIEQENSYYLFLPKGKTVSDCTEEGIIFYPGAKVEETAYGPMLKELAIAGHPVYLMKMPFHFAVLDKNAADEVIAQYPERNWILMGHSLGGAMAESYTKEHLDEVDGLVLLGAYGTADISKTDVKVLLIYGSNDLVLNKEKYIKNQKNNPKSSVEYVIEGGNHANYGYYGKQKGDGTAEIAPKEQQEQVVDQIQAMFVEKEGK